MPLISLDMPMPLGHHLHALRTAIVRPLILFVVSMIVAFCFQVELKELILRPLWKAIELAGPETAAKIGFPQNHEEGYELYGIELPRSASGAWIMNIRNGELVIAPSAPADANGASASAAAMQTAMQTATQAASATSGAAVRLRRLRSAENRLLYTLEMAESTITAVKVSMVAAIFVTLPYLLWKLWQFVAVGLTTRERRLAFLFFPAGVLSFYTGCIVGYLLCLPWFYKFLIDFQSADSTAWYMLRQSEYVNTFIMWTIAFGVICIIPWAVMVLVRVGFVTPETLSKVRRYVILVNLVAAAMITPTSDLWSLSALFIPMQLFFEIGLLLSRLVRPKPRLTPHEDHPDHA